MDLSNFVLHYDASSFFWQIQRLEHVNRKLGGTNGFSKLAHQQEVSDPSDDDEDMSKLELRFSPRTSVENLTS
jgi:hypothetical protein